MPRTAREVPPPLELLCLRALWSLGEGNVKDVLQIVVRTRPLAYTTIMTVLDRLVRKGKSFPQRSGRAFVYRPEASRDRYAPRRHPRVGRFAFQQFGARVGPFLSPPKRG